MGTNGFALEKLSFELGLEGWGGGIGKNDMHHGQRKQHKQRQRHVSQGQGFLKDILEKVEFMNENRGEFNVCIYLLTLAIYWALPCTKHRGIQKKKSHEEFSLIEKEHNVHKLLPVLQRISKRILEKD